MKRMAATVDGENGILNPTGQCAVFFPRSCRVRFGGSGLPQQARARSGRSSSGEQQRNQVGGAVGSGLSSRSRKRFFCSAAETCRKNFRMDYAFMKVDDMSRQLTAPAAKLSAHVIYFH